jgi:hypothetical protein
VVGEYLPALIPRLAGHDKGIALVTVLLFAALQWRGIRWGSFTQNVTSALKTLSLYRNCHRGVHIRGRLCSRQTYGRAAGLCFVHSHNNCD